MSELGPEWEPVTHRASVIGVRCVLAGLAFAFAALVIAGLLACR